VPAGPLSRYRDLEVIAADHERRGATQSLPVRRVRVALEPIARRHRHTAYEPLDLIALRHLGREEMYWRLLDANDGRLPGSFEVGEVLAVPSRDTATQVRRSG
jgi:hypothetical protein